MSASPTTDVIAQATLEHLYWLREEGIDLWPPSASSVAPLEVSDPVPESSFPESPAVALRPLELPRASEVVASPIPAQSPVTPVTIEGLRAELGDCQRCKLAPTRSNIVYGIGDAHAKLMFVGEGPGADEDLQGEPFVGKAGQLLTKMIEAMGLSRERVYIANIIKCRPPRNRNPEPDEIAACHPFLDQQIACIQPKVICTLGAFAAQTVLQTTTRISALRGRFQDKGGVKIMPTFHPAYLLRNPAEKKKVWQDLQQIMAELHLSPPAKER